MTGSQALLLFLGYPLAAGILAGLFRLALQLPEGGCTNKAPHEPHEWDWRTGEFGCKGVQRR